MHFWTKVALFFLGLTIISVRSQLRTRNEGSMEEEPALGVEPSNSTLWGPGLAPHAIVLPARYFFVRLVGPGGRRANTSVQVREALKVRIDCNGDRQVWTQVLDRKDGSFIVRYKLFQSCLAGFRIIVTFQKKHVGKSPIKIQAPVHPDPCYCPMYDLTTWLQRARCPTSYAQIDNDLAPFENVDFDSVLDKAIEAFYNPGAHSFCHYAIQNNEIYRKCYGQHVGFHIFPDAILLSLTRKVYLPDMEFIMNLGDWPLVDTGRPDKPIIPIFSWCKTNSTADILLPTYEIMEASLEAMGRVSLDMMTVQSNSDLEWKEKIPKLFWRGRDSRKQRLELIALSRKHEHLINASLTNFFFFRDKEAIYGPKAPHVSFFEFFDYKYQLNIDGTVAAYRFPFLLGGDSVVFKVDSSYVEHFYTNLKPWRHYIPVESNLEDLVEKIDWAIEHDEQARLIGEHGRKYAQEHLMPLDVICYHATVLKEWSERLQYPVTIRSDMELVSQQKDVKNIVCDCKPAPKKMVRDKKEL